MESHYRTLELEPGSTLEQVELAYKQLIQIWHPDRFANDPDLSRRAEVKAREAPRPKARPPGKSKVPVARPAPPRVQVEGTDDEAPEEAVLLTPAGIKGWAISGALHALLLVILALWVFSPPKKGPPQIDTRLAGSEFGVPEGINTLGGIDTPITMPEPTPSPPMPDAKVTQLKSDDLMVADPSAGFTGQAAKNPGAGLGDGFGLAKFGQGGESIRGVEVKVGDPQFTLIWDSKADLDLHVVEPGGKEIYWLDTRGNHNGELDVDNREGFGPENIYWLQEKKDGSKEMGLGPAGDYRWWVHYYRGFDGSSIPTRWKVRVKHDGKVETFQGRLAVKDARSKEFVLKIDPAPGREVVRGK
jgi:hypothetical protein